MNKRFWILIIAILVILVGACIFFFASQNTNNTENVSNEQNTSNYETNRVSINNPNGISNTNVSSNDNTVPEEEVIANEPAPQQENESNAQAAETAPQNTTVEEELSSFSTKIYSNDAARQNNINITCAALDGTTVSNGETFSFCKTLGPSTTAKGYEKADVFDANGNKKKGLGGGNCQISTTLYNAVLPVANLTITERHKHSNYVPYVKTGLDAAVAYGSYDLKFVNNTGNDIKIKADSNGKSVDVSLYTIINK